jgi:hypothetical protein
MSIGIRARHREVATRRRTLVTAGAALAILLIASWLAFDWLLLGEGATRFSKPDSIKGGQSLGPITRGRRSEAGPSGAELASAPAGKDDFGPVRGVAPSSEILDPSLADATDYHGTGQNGERNSNPVPNGSTPSGVPAASQDAGAGPDPQFSARSDLLRAPVEPVIGAAPPGLRAETGSDNPAAPPGLRAKTGSDKPADLVTGGGSDNPSAGASTDLAVKSTTVPAPSSLLLFGTSALVLWTRSRMLRGRKEARPRQDGARAVE